jgi:quercetin dioxygenase-like cupin family protein
MITRTQFTGSRAGLTMSSGITRLAVGVAMAVATAGASSANGTQAETVAPKFAQAIPNVPGKSLVAVEVDYAPGAASPRHTHAKSAFIYAYVISGEIISQVNDGPAQIFKAGEGWSEAPGAIHAVSRNASRLKPAKLLAIFVVDTGDTKLTTPIK